MASKSVFRKLQVFVKSTDFRAATKLVDVPLVEPADDQIRVRNVFAGVNATDINITAARYFTDGKIPFDIGLEVSPATGLHGHFSNHLESTGSWSRRSSWRQSDDWFLQAGSTGFGGAYLGRFR